MRYAGLFAVIGAMLAAGAALSADRVWDLEGENTRLCLKAAGDDLFVTCLSAPRSNWQWITSPSRVGFINSAVVDGKKVPLVWKFERGDRGILGNKVIAVRFRCESPALELVSVWSVVPSGPGPVRHEVNIINRSRKQVMIGLQPSLQLSLRAPAGAALETLRVQKGAGRPSDDGVLLQQIQEGNSVAARSTPYSEDDPRDHIPFIAVRDAGSGAGLYFGVESSARVSLSVARKNGLSVWAGLNGDPAPYSSRIEAGESYVAPAAFVGTFTGDFDDAANSLRRWLARHVRPAAPDKRFPLLTNNSWGSGMAVDEELSKRMIDESAALGLELFHIDAGWFAGVGDWRYHPQKFPNGVAAVREYAKSKGLLFGLWTAWTQGGNTVRADQSLSPLNPEMKGWFTGSYAADWRPADFHGATVCLGSREAARWCLAEVRRIVGATGIDLLEHDQEMVVQKCERADHAHTSHPSDVAYHASRGYYHIYDQIRRENPSLLFENCVNGGRMVDFGALRRAHYFSITDSYDPLSNRRAIYDAAYVLPPSSCECYVKQAPGPNIETFRTMLRSGMMGMMTLMCDSSVWSKEQHTVAKRQFEVYRERLRPLIQRADLYHVSERPHPEKWDAMLYYDRFDRVGAVLAFRGEKAASEHDFVLKGLDPSMSYRLSFEDRSQPEMTALGADLMSTGLKMKLGTPGASEIVFIEQAK